MEYTTERGVTIGVVPIPLLLDEIKKAHRPPACPTYTEHLAGGATQDVEITEAMAATWAKDNPDGWAEHAAAWAEYERARDANEERLNEAVWRAIMLKSLVFNLPDSEEWIAEQETMGLSVPNGKTERRIHYIRTEMIGGLKDILRLTAMANGADLDEGVLATAEASFRGSLQRLLTRGLTRE